VPIPRAAVAGRPGIGPQAHVPPVLWVIYRETTRRRTLARRNGEGLRFPGPWEWGGKGDPGPAVPGRHGPAVPGVTADGKRAVARGFRTCAFGGPSLPVVPASGCTVAEFK
jgi:hypothetical protein